jgi:hypothetical protein
VAVFTAGLAWSLVPGVREVRAAPPRTDAAWMLLAGSAWLVIARPKCVLALLAIRPERPCGRLPGLPFWPGPAHSRSW